MPLECGSRITFLLGLIVFVLVVICSNSILAVTFLRQRLSLESLAQQKDWARADLVGPTTNLLTVSIKEDINTDEQFLGSPLGRFFNNTLVHTRSTWNSGLLTLSDACPIILSGRHERSGLGHAFMSFNALVGVANFYNITLNATFPERLSHSPELEEVAKFFNGDIFQPKFSHVDCKENIDASSKTLADIVEGAKRTCTSGRPICINITKEVPPGEVLVDVTNYRKHFAVPDSTSGALKGLPFFDNDYLRVGIHMRRGDIINRTRWTKRWITNQAYLEFIPKLLGRIKTKLPIALIIFAEGAKSIKEIPDVLADNFDDFSVLHPNVTLGPREMHLTLASFCSTDVLITSPSGYSHLAALLCEKTHILAVPFWHSYAALPNTLTELSVVRNETGAIVKLDMPASFHHEWRI